MTRASAFFRLSNFYLWYFAFVGAYGPFFALYLQDRGFDPLRIAILMAVGPVARIFVPNFWGWLADRYRARGRIQRIVAFVAPFIAAGLLLHPGFVGMLCLLIVWSLFWAGLLPLVEASTMNVLRARMGAYGRIRLWGSIGFIVVVVCGGYLFDAWGVGMLEYVLLVLLALTAMTVFALPRDRTKKLQEEEKGSLRVALLKPGVVGMIGGFFLMQVAHAPYNTFYSIYLVDAGYSKTAIGWLWALGVVAEIVLFFWLPQLMRRWRLEQILVACFSFAVVRFLMIAWGVGSLPVLLIAQLMHAMTFGAFHAAGVAATHRVFSGELQSRGQALYSSLGYGAGGALGTLAAGYAWESLGGAMTFSLSAAAALIGLLAVRKSLPQFQ
ncbi:MAG: MFS transporter [Burkholderiales bacterium]|jgi:PPP family 3-phenylpropionic acid transporter